MYQVNLDKLARHLEASWTLPWAHASYVGDPNQGVIQVTYKDNPKRQYILGAGAPVLAKLSTQEAGGIRRADFKVERSAKKVVLPFYLMANCRDGSDVVGVMYRIRLRDLKRELPPVDDTLCKIILGLE